MKQGKNDSNKNQRIGEKKSCPNSQKRIIKFINDMKVTTIYDLIKINKRIEETESEEIWMSGIEEQEKPAFVIQKNEIPDIIYIITNLDNICTYLQSRKLINIIDTKENFIPFCTKALLGYAPETELNENIKKYTNKKFVSTMALEEYINNGYKTNEEVELNNERNARIKAEKFTKWIAIFSIIVSALVGIGTTIFNYITYTKEREMVIKNPGQINYPVEIHNMDKYLEMQEKYLQRIDEIFGTTNKVKATEKEITE
jgi:hypothetical protein